ncbi:major facilitator superfamily domain-containing protein [Rhizoctonia solani]|nr:major facilitator superfamily domain-containing protein [Rhizoctonia solani]
MSSPPESSQPSTNVLLSVAPTGLRERRASAHAATNVRGIFDMTGISAVPESAILDIEDADPVKEDVKQPVLIPQIPTLSQLPSLYIDKQSASISGYTPGSLTPGYSGSNTPAAVGREAYFEDAFKSSGDIIEHNSDTPRLKRRLALSFFGFFCAGWSDGITGTVLPRFEETYHVDYLTVSLLFVASTVGFAIGTIIIEPLFNGLGRFSLAARRRRFFPVFPSHISRVETGISLSQGRCGVLFFGGLSQAIYFTIAASKAPFPAMIVGFGFSGIGISLLSGQYNAFVAAQKSAGRYLGWLHGFYGVGAFASPLVGQTLLARGWQWPRFFIISVCLGCINTILILYTFHTTQQEFQEEKAKAIELLRQEHEAIELEARTNDGEATIASRTTRRRSRSRSAGERSAMRMTLASPVVWVFAIFLCTYTGSETTTGGWIVSFLLKERNADPDTVGYVASGFWGGLAVGRLLLGQMSPYIGLKREKHLVHIYIGIALVMTVLVWKVPSFVGNAFCTAIVGFVLGPIFPTSLSLATKLLPTEIHMTALATMSSFASIGSALYPFITGVIANTKGVAVLQPMMLGILSVMAGLWCFFPTRSIT